MARKPRIHYPGAIYHVMLRGNAGEKIFFNDSNRKYFYELIADGIRRYEYRIHAFCLMSNHVHFAIQVGDRLLSSIMQNLAFRYARMINTQKGRVGHLFQGRYKAILIDSDHYIKELVRYIHLNPVRARMISNVNTYRWSSHRAYLGLEKIVWLTTDWVLSFFSEEKVEARNRYKQFIKDVNESMQSDLYRGNQKNHDILGDEQFLQKLRHQLILPTSYQITFDQFFDVVRKHYGIVIEELRGTSQNHRNSRIRAVVALLAKEFRIATFTSIAKFFNRDMTGLCHVIRSFEDKPDFQNEVRMLANKLKDTNIQA